MSFRQVTAFKEDCRELMDKFADTKSLKFVDFAAVWREMKFSYVFLGQRLLGNMRQFAEEALTIAKYFWLQSDTVSNSVAGLYLIYGLNSKQRLPGLVHLPLTSKEFELVKEFASNLCGPEHLDIAYILQSLFENELFYFSATSAQFGLEAAFKQQSYNLSLLPRMQSLSNDYAPLKKFVHVYKDYLASKKDIGHLVEDLRQQDEFLTNLTSDYKSHLLDTPAEISQTTVVVSSDSDSSEEEFQVVGGLQDSANNITITAGHDGDDSFSNPFPGSSRVMEKDPLELTVLAEAPLEESEVSVSGPKVKSEKRSRQMLQNEVTNLLHELDIGPSAIAVGDNLIQGSARFPFDTSTSSSNVDGEYSWIFMDLDVIEADAYVGSE